MAELEREKLIYELDAYAHTVAHDLKNPLALTIGYGELLAAIHPFTHENQAIYLERMQKNGRRMLQIVDELLLLATVIGQDHISVEPISMSDLIQAVLERFETTISQTQAEICLPEQFPLVKGYGPWIEEVWANYISNALKYGGEPPHITVGFDTSAATDLVRFWVKDNGDGLELSAQKRLFQEFERLEQKRAQGHGLGLSVVRRIIERLNGQVGVESEIGSGCLFFFTLPAVPAVPQEKSANVGLLSAPN
jgi:signal transduction histidine kinase